MNKIICYLIMCSPLLLAFGAWLTHQNDKDENDKHNRGTVQGG